MEHKFPLGSFQRENGTIFSGILFIPENFQWNEPKSRVPFTSQPEFSGFFGKWKTSLVTMCSVANREGIVILFAGGKLQLTYSGLPPVEGCTKSSNSKVVFYFECGQHVGQPQFER